LSRIITIAILTGLLLPGCRKDDVAATCRLNTAEKWSPEIVKICVEPWSAFANSLTVPKCSDTDQAKEYMAQCMAAEGYELTARCRPLRLEQFDSKCYTKSGISPLDWALDALFENHFLFESNPRPWSGYAWNHKEKRLEWMQATWVTHSECKAGVARIVRERRMWYSAPTGCGYSGNSYWRVRAMNALYGGSELGCIGISASSGDAHAKERILFSPALGQNSRSPSGSAWHCV
jgi:hypothetical protein